MIDRQFLFEEVPSVDRVPAHTADAINERISAEMSARVQYFASRPEGIPGRLKELEEEWDIERAIEANASALAFSGVVLGAASDRRWLILPVLVTAFLFQHAIQGWCPPVPILRRLGFRTAYEIDQERYALKALRGDFQVAGANKAQSALKAVAA